MDSEMGSRLKMDFVCLFCIRFDSIAQQIKSAIGQG